MIWMYSQMPTKKFCVYYLKIIGGVTAAGVPKSEN